MFVFIFAQINFAFYRELFREPESTGLYCETMYQCFVSVFHRGLILSLFEVRSEINNPFECITTN